MSLTQEETIYNEALGYIGEYQITEGKVTEKQYVICKRYYDKARKMALSAHPWNEAKGRTILPTEDYDPVFGYQYRYEILIVSGRGSMFWSP